MRYYVYIHQDPSTHQILYVGLGQRGRALDNHKRSAAHAECLRSMWADYPVEDWCRFVGYYDTRRQAAEREQALIVGFRPPFNQMGLTAANAGRGTANHNAKLDDDKVIQLRAHHASGHSIRATARTFGISYGVARGIIKGERWSHVQ